MDYNGIELCVSEIKEVRIIKELEKIVEMEDRFRIWKIFEEHALTHINLYDCIQNQLKSH